MGNLNHPGRCERLLITRRVEAIVDVQGIGAVKNPAGKVFCQIPVLRRGGQQDQEVMLLQLLQGWVSDNDSLSFVITKERVFFFDRVVIERYGALAEQLALAEPLSKFPSDISGVAQKGDLKILPCGGSHSLPPGWVPVWTARPGSNCKSRIHKALRRWCIQDSRSNPGSPTP
ncbi:MAG: hypothetical protein BWY86_01437 [Candidatus Aminicenantes bacterium ADurb.Bin508]|nr:MAG: hypothetical protein BWY86_01437 [Candidatus Aminicenantes bacterium ADurb.Bin508]